MDDPLREGNFDAAGVELFLRLLLHVPVDGPVVRTFHPGAADEVDRRIGQLGDSDLRVRFSKHPAICLDHILEDFLGCFYIIIVADSISADVGRMAVNHWNVRLVQRKFRIEDLKNIDFVFLATSDGSLHKSIAEIAKKMKILVNVADTPELCDFYMGSVVQKGYLKIGISTNGKSPTIAKRLRIFLNDIR